VPIFKDNNVVDDEPFYIGNGQGCGTFWFRNVEEAKKFIETHRDKIKLTDLGIVRGLIPKELCKNCKNNYSYGTDRWKRAKSNNCFDYKEQLKAGRGVRRKPQSS